MIDYFLKYTNEAAAKADQAALSDALGVPLSEEWRLQHTLPNVKAWRISQDTMQGDPLRVVHQYLTGWFLIIALERHEPIIMSWPALQFALDREACNNGQKFVLKNNIGAIIQDVGCEPIFAGSTYPMGGYD